MESPARPSILTLLPPAKPSAPHRHPGSRPGAGLFLVHSRTASPLSDTQAHAQTIVADIRRHLSSGEYSANFPDTRFFPPPAPVDTPLRVVRRILGSLRSISPIA